ncbi:MAG: lytic transglycosylase domain-containing protein [Pseudomonadota bacterium]
MRRFISVAAAACLLWSSPLWADTPPPLPEFSSKRVGVPKPGGAKRITIQIDPALAYIQPLPSDRTEVEEETVVSAAVAPVKPVGRYDWFWKDVAADMTANGAQRSMAAVEALEKVAGSSRDVSAPRAQDLRVIIDAYGTDILLKSLETKVSPALALAVIAVESSGRIDAVSSAGAKGLMQLMPATAERFGVFDTTAAENIRGGIEYLDWLIRHFDGDPVLALAGYNAGEGAVAEHGGVPPYPETRDYIPKVIAAWRVVRLLCKTPPAFLEDGCVFEGKNSPT